MGPSKRLGSALCTFDMFSYYETTCLHIFYWFISASWCLASATLYYAFFSQAF